MSACAVVDVSFPLARLGGLRREKGLTQEQVGRMVGVRAEVVSIIERAAQPGDTIERIIRALVDLPAQAQR
jgi:transcriptional regulator with XRE-family HTH domain